VRYRNLIGDRILELDKGRRSAQPLAAGGTIAIAQTAPAVDLDALLNGFKPLFAGLDPSQINQLSGQLVEVLQGQTTAHRPPGLVGRLVHLDAGRPVGADHPGGQQPELRARRGGRAARTVSASCDPAQHARRRPDKQDTQVLDAAADINRMARPDLTCWPARAAT
jgi:phospholipid/cholesterol/gamma-HCH transport system substrate-binding protein